MLHPLTRDGFGHADLELTPDDGMRYELVDGVLVVTPIPLPAHQWTIGRLLMLLDGACPIGLEVFTYAAFWPDERLGLQPDLLICQTPDLSKRAIEHAVLVVEVSSSATSAVDRVLKPALYARAGVGSYWIVEADQPRVSVLELEDGQYVERAAVSGGEVVEVDRPFRFRVAPAEWVWPGGVG